MAQFRFGQKTAIYTAMSIPQKVYAEDIIIVCNAFDTGNSSQQVSETLIPDYAEAFKSYSLAVHYFESIVKHGTMNYCTEHMLQSLNISF